MPDLTAKPVVYWLWDTHQGQLSHEEIVGRLRGRPEPSGQTLTCFRHAHAKRAARPVKEEENGRELNR